MDGGSRGGGAGGCGGSFTSDGEGMVRAHDVYDSCLCKVAWRRCLRVCVEREKGSETGGGGDRRGVKFEMTLYLYIKKDEYEFSD